MTLSPLRITAASIAATVLLVALQSCTRKAEQPLPAGTQTMTGVLVPVPLSKTRRGTHVLTQQGERVYLVESARADLRDFEGVDVVVTGKLERNTDPDALAVLLASGVTLVDMPARMWEIDSLEISLETPATWSIQEFDDGTQFTETGATHVLLKIYPATITALPAGTMLQVAGRKAVRVNASGTQTVYVLNGRTILTFLFQPDANTPLTAAERDFNRVLRSVKFGTSTSSGSGTSVSTSSSSQRTGTGSAPSGAPCGGPAGVLCPSGQYCEVTDPVDGIGRCRALKQ